MKKEKLTWTWYYADVELLFTDGTTTSVEWNGSAGDLENIAASYLSRFPVPYSMYSGNEQGYTILEVKEIKGFKVLDIRAVEHDFETVGG